MRSSLLEFLREYSKYGIPHTDSVRAFTSHLNLCLISGDVECVSVGVWCGVPIANLLSRRHASNPIVSAMRGQPTAAVPNHRECLCTINGNGLLDNIRYVIMA